MRMSTNVECDVAYCRTPAISTMHWPDESRPFWALCAKDDKFYRSIAGKHIRFETIEFEKFQEKGVSA